MTKKQIKEIFGEYLEDIKPTAHVEINSEEKNGGVGATVKIDGRGDIVLYSLFAFIDQMADRIGKRKLAGLLMIYLDECLLAEKDDEDAEMLS